MELNFKKVRYMVDSDGFWISILPDKTEDVNKAKKFIDKIKDKLYTAHLKEYREKRSLDSNAYCWILCQKLGGKLGLPPEEVYKQAIRHSGNYYVTPIKKEAIQHYKRIWSSNGIGWFAEELGEAKTEGYINLLSYYGSSQYDTKQMAQLIDTLVQEAKAQGIETATPEEIAKMQSLWGQDNEKHTAK